MKRFLLLLALVLIMILFCIAAFAGHVEAAEPAPQGMYTESNSWLRADEAEAMLCIVNGDREAIRATMYISPNDMTPNRGYPLVLSLEYYRSNGNCHFWRTDWTPGNLGLYHASTEFNQGGGLLIYHHDSAHYARLWLPMAFTFYPENRP